MRQCKLLRYSIGPFFAVHLQHASGVFHLLTIHQIALEDFLAHITNRIVQPFLQDKHGSVVGLSTDYISGLSEEGIEMLEGEDEAVIARRKEANAEIKGLEDAMRIAEQT